MKKRLGAFHTKASSLLLLVCVSITLVSCDMIEEILTPVPCHRNRQLQSSVRRAEVN